MSTEYAIRLGDGSMQTTYSPHVGRHTATFTDRNDANRERDRIAVVGIIIDNGRIRFDEKYTRAVVMQRTVPEWEVAL